MAAQMRTHTNLMSRALKKMLRAHTQPLEPAVVHPLVYDWLKRQGHETFLGRPYVVQERIHIAPPQFFQGHKIVGWREAR